MTRLATLACLIETHDAIGEAQKRIGTVCRQLERTRRYLARPGSNPQLGRAHLDRLAALYRRAVADLRSARGSAHQQLGITRHVVSRLG